MTLSRRQLGIFQIILSGACFGFLGFFGKTAFSLGFLPAELLSLRFSVSALFLGTYALCVGVNPFTLPKTKILGSLLLGALGYAVFSSFYFYALKGLSASLTVLLLYTYPVLVSIGARFVWKEQLGSKGLVALLLSTVGMTALVWGEWQVSDPLYLFFGLGSALFYALYILLSDKFLASVPPLASTFYIQIGAGAALGFFIFRDPSRPVQLIENNFLLIFAMATVCSLLAMTLFQAGLQKLSSAETSILSTSEPFFGVLIATLLLGEKISYLQGLGGLLIIAGMILLATRQKTQSSH